MPRFEQHEEARKPSPLDAEGHDLPGPRCSLSPLRTPGSFASMSSRLEIDALEGSLDTARLQRLPSRKSNKSRKATKSTAMVAVFLEQNGYLHVNGAKWSWGRRRHPLHTAVRQNLPATVRALLQLGASRTAVSGGLTAEEAAQRYERRWGGYAEVLSIFKELDVMAQECSRSTNSPSESDEQLEDSTACASEDSTSEPDRQQEDATRRVILL
mmetsp:Transcript_29786/g.70879  ORF Transcript_29786/g.70879 Transcript_29786/m.70879 type:complete len:213 (+) Transcript_29786:57-695(+)|eukprot:CAMPEP_0181414158 /NCGR_PEP_ID=MMETSP1110-20121109/9358_1 /TAXON_ID=174948 /ORGANISM="Symbiodinium sp., Strain CCMP421" /LENGTH=212 /DNA_ID=CAMNT_0023537023 /DNA_START=52 /DNA_END=690 /DNA_ORIENTATION=+